MSGAQQELAHLPLPASVVALGAEATVQRTSSTLPGMDGDIVWHVWGERAPGTLPLVLFHGGSGSWTHWLRNIDALVATGRQVWAVDLPGFGDSVEPPKGSDADAIIEPLYESMRELFGPQPCDLVGFSFGGMTAGMLLAAHPELARQLVLVGAPAMGVVPQRQFELKAWRHLPPEAQLAAHRFNLAALMLRDTALIEGEALALHVGNVVRDRMQRRRLAHTDILARSLPQVHCPVHAIYGESDSLYKEWISALEQAYAKAAPDFRGFALIPEAGHWVQYERPAAFHDALLAALRDGAQ
ncbi:alpha/beta hydrolase [Diaphorobacter sp.]|uniref:alpha/beta fold hydrolase n=1 Tax=Diaphorobacter sp. TaxID=1934310 RepID=UPI0028AE7EF6|nr:alpha/beta hydrolase [Diaphorobacter sp.]